MSMNDYTVADKNYDNDNNLESFLLIWESGEPELKSATPENHLLYIEELYEFLNGNHGVRLSKDPLITVEPTEEEYTYVITVRDETVTSFPKQSQRVLEGIQEVITDGKTNTIEAVHRDIRKNQVNQSLMNVLITTFSDDEQERIDSQKNGWVIDDMYVLDWDAQLFQEDADDKHYNVEGRDAVPVDTSHELLTLVGMQFESGDIVTVNGTEHELTETETEFLAKAKFVLHREQYVQDVPFWVNADSEAQK